MKRLQKICNASYDGKNIFHNALFVLMALIMVFYCFRVQDSIEHRKRETVAYPVEHLSYASQYIKQFDAFKKGQLYLDVEVSKGLLNLENPYDPAERDEAKVSFLWDHAYFEGKYYSYFGIAPLATVYLPVYLFTGALPNDVLACTVLAVYAVIFSALAYREVVLRFCKKASLWLFLACECAFIASSGVYLGMLCSDIYYIAVLSALASSMAFVFFAFRAMRERNIPLRAALLALAALTLTLTVLSRPTAALMCMAVMPIFAEFLLKIKRENLREGVVTVCSFAVPLAMGAGFVMWYNAARFGSPFDFGASYQLTLSDISKNTLEAGFFPSSLFSYFAYPFWLYEGAPRVVMGVQILVPPDTRWVYSDNYAGAFAHALPLAVMFYSRVRTYDKKDGGGALTKDAFVALACALAVFVAFFDFCYAGVNMRYIYDIVATLSLAGSFVLLDLQGRAKGRVKIFATAVCIAFIAAAFFAGDAVVETIRLRF